MGYTLWFLKQSLGGHLSREINAGGNLIGKGKWENQMGRNGGSLYESKEERTKVLHRCLE